MERHVHFELTALQEIAAARHETQPRSPVRRLSVHTDTPDAADTKQEEGAPIPMQTLIIVAVLLLALFAVAVGAWYLVKSAKMHGSKKQDAMPSGVVP